MGTRDTLRLTVAGYPEGSSWKGWTGEELIGSKHGRLGSGGFVLAGWISRAAVVRQSANTPPEVWAGPMGKWKQITNLNERCQSDLG